MSKGMYQIECGTYTATFLSMVQAIRNAKRVGLARCEVAIVRELGTGRVIYEF